MIRRAKLYARVAEDGQYSRMAVAHDRNGRPIEPKPKNGHITTYQIRVAGKFIDAEAGDSFTMAVTRLRQEQARLADGLSRVKAVNVVLTVVENEAPGRIRLSDAAAEFATELRKLDRGK